MLCTVYLGCICVRVQALLLRRCTRPQEVLRHPRGERHTMSQRGNMVRGTVAYYSLCCGDTFVTFVVRFFIHRANLGHNWSSFEYSSTTELRERILANGSGRDFLRHGQTVNGGKYYYVMCVVLAHA
ncbi:hypothetical protein TNCV_1914501 [Trichonephila clavipes]|nr:hypothetical protein TNCV_1914501 [Trichonephila clavipes]